ncbi:MAG: helix-turn-helix domain-containing protein [bacterium]|nr:helix-turn-helix domain-containing protein [bacterium]
MIPGDLFSEPEGRKQKYSLGDGFVLEFSDQEKKHCHLLHYDQPIKIVDLSDKLAKKLLIIEAVQLGVIQSRLAEALGISRQTIHNYLEIHKRFGTEGLVHNYNPGESNDREKQRKLHASERAQGNKAEQVAAIRAEQRAAEKAQQESLQASLNFSFGENDRSRQVPAEQQPFSQNHDWEATRYAGIFLYWISLITHWNWLHLILGHFGKAWRIFAVFLLMSGRNIRSIEQIKHVRKREAGRVLGLGRVPSKTILWEWFYEAARSGLARTLLNDYFRHQIRCGLICSWIWFTDGHLLPYTGKEKVHYSYNTQRRMPVPGRTSQVTCDASGRIVDFVIEEGKGEMKQQILEVVEQWLPELPARPIAVFDREGYDSGYFSKLVKAGQPFVTWDKNVDTKRLGAIPDERFTIRFEFNGKRYSVLEAEKTFRYAENEEQPEHIFTLRHLIIWNHSSHRRTAGLAHDGSIVLSTEEATRAILSRWGASENTFKHIRDRHPLHYHPGFKLVDSARQEIGNPEIKDKSNLLARLGKKLDRLLRKLLKTPESKKKDGSPRRNSRRQRMEDEIQQQQALIEQIRKEKQALPEKIDVSKLTDYRSFKQIDNEGKYLFDAVTTAVWNVRKQMTDWLRECYECENDLVDLFYAITDCHGWIRCTDAEVRVRLEPLQQAKRRAAQEYLCRKLSSFGAQTPMGKRLLVEVGESPMK